MKPEKSRIEAHGHNYLEYVQTSTLNIEKKSDACVSALKLCNQYNIVLELALLTWYATSIYVA
jgi:hypothetical protein